MRTIEISIMLAASLGVADAKPHRHIRDSRWVKDCITERTGPTGGIPVTEARKICRAEEPEDEVEASKRQLAVARAKAKLAKAKAKLAKVIEACEQAVVDVCVETALPDGSTDCEDSALKAQFSVCH